MVVKPVGAVAVRLLVVVVLVGLHVIRGLDVLRLVPLEHLDHPPHLDGGHGDPVLLVLQAILDVKLTGDQY